jgi:DNA-binding ferritin-like protein
MKEAAEFVLTLLHAATNVHLLHWQTKNYAEHVALGEFYTELPELVDQLAEAIMGRYDITFTFKDSYYTPAATGKAELESLKEYVQEERKEIPQDSEIQNLTDEISQLIDKTLYLLRFP